MQFVICIADDIINPVKNSTNMLEHYAWFLQEAFNVLDKILSINESTTKKVAESLSSPRN